MRNAIRSRIAATTFLTTLLLILGISIFPSSAYSASTEYYVDDATGSDLDDGLSEVDAWETIQHAVDNVAAPGADGEYSRINIKNTNTYVITLTIDVDITAGSTDRPIILEGYSSTIGDGGMAIIDCDDGDPDAAVVFNVDLGYYVFKNLQMQDATDDLWQGGTACTLLHCKLLNAGDFGAWSGWASWLVIDTEITNATDGASFNTCYLYLYNYIHDTEEGCDGSNFIGNLFDTTSKKAIFSNADRGFIIGNTVYNSTTDNIAQNNVNVEQLIVVNNILDTTVAAVADSYNVDIDAGANIFFFFGNNYTNGATGDLSGTIFITTIASGTATNFSTAFTFDGADDFNISDDLDDQGWPTAFLGNAATTFNLEPGACMYEEAAAAAGGRGARFLIQ